MLLTEQRPDRDMMSGPFFPLTTNDDSHAKVTAVATLRNARQMKITRKCTKFDISTLTDQGYKSPTVS